MIDRVRRIGRALGYFLAYAYALIAVWIIGTLTAVGYVVGAAGYYEGWTTAGLDARAVMVTDTVVETLSADALGTAFLAIMSPVFALLDNLFLGAARLGYATHSELFAHVLGISLPVAGGCYAAIRADAVLGGEPDG